MYKLLIADDEALEREALRFFVEDSRLDISEIIECANGAEALAAALEKKPDIMVLDIKMPGLSGHEVLEQARAANLKCKIILSTAYSYFNYAVKALQLGAMEFLVKPVQKELVIRTINKAIDQLDEESRRDREHGLLRDASHMLERRMLECLLRGEVDEEVLWYLNANGFPTETGGCCFFADMLPDAGGVRRKIESNLRTGLKEAGFRYMLAVGSTALCLLVFSDCQEAKASIVETVEVLTENIFLENGAAYSMLKAEWVSSPEEVEQAHVLLHGEIGRPEKKNTFLRMEQHAQTNETQTGNKDMPPEIDALIAYIGEHYSEKHSLDSLARVVGFSKFYISRLFKQHTGVTIMDYLIGVRMDKAKDLLAKSDQSIKQIGFTVGYSDSNYFTWSFKKYLGVSPVKYRYSKREAMSKKTI